MKHHAKLITGSWYLKLIFKWANYLNKKYLLLLVLGFSDWLLWLLDVLCCPSDLSPWASAWCICRAVVRAVAKASLNSCDFQSQPLTGHSNIGILTDLQLYNFQGNKVSYTHVIWVDITFWNTKHDLQHF